MSEFVIVGVCLLLNAVLACVEMAFVTVSRPQIRQMAQAGNKDAQRLLSLRDNPERTLSIIQIGITFVGAISAAVGGAGAEEKLSPFFMNQFGLAENAAETISIAVVVIPITFLSVVFGELVPKTIALKQPLKISFFGTRWLILLDKVLAPAVGIFEHSTKLVLKCFFPKLKSERVSEEAGLNLEIDSLSEPHRQYMINLAHLEKKKVNEIMVPWVQVATLHSKQTLEEVLTKMLESAHSRIPIIEEGEVKGFVYSKEMMALSATGVENWNAVIRPILKVTETDSLLKVMRLMQEKRSHLCLVFSRDAKLLGIVTLEDIIEEVVGEIYDEDDDGNLKRILAAGAKMRGNRFGKGGALFLKNLLRKTLESH